MDKNVARLIAAGGAVATVFGFSAGPAGATGTAGNPTVYANSKTSSPGGGNTGTCSLKTWSTVSYLTKDNTARLTCTVNDGENDGNRVCLEFWRDGYAHSSRCVENGSLPFSSTFGGGDSISRVYFKVYEDLSFQPDPQGPTVSWVAGDVKS